MEQLINSIRPYLEALSFISGILVAIAALSALRQIQLMKLDILSRSERAAKEKAVEAACEFARLGEVFIKHTQGWDITIPMFYDGPIGDFSSNSIPEESKEMAQRRFSLGVMNTPLDMLDGIAATFVTGVADEKTAFSICGGGFCGTVAGQYDIICLARKTYSYGPYENIIQLYVIWSARLSKIDLEKARQNIDKQIQNIPDKEISPLAPNIGRKRIK